MNMLGLSKLYAQYIGKNQQYISFFINRNYMFSYYSYFLSVRAILGLCVIGAFQIFRKTVQSVFGRQLTNWFVAVTVTQYHFMYYLSRPLPNILVLPLGNL